MLEMVSEWRPVIGVVTNSLVGASKTGTRSVWETDFLFMQHHPYPLIPNFNILSINFNVLSSVLGFSFQL